jgi:gliding-associated putative ABC transporter substrate-binding component GldG
MASRKLKLGSNAVLYSTLTVGILVLVNIVASRQFGRLDLTEDRIYTISAASKKLVASLPDRLTAKAFISSDLPPQVRGIARYLRDMLDEFKTASNGRMSFEALDPGKDDKVKEEARRLKVQQARLSVLEKTKAQVSESYLGVAFQYGGKIESIPFVTDISTLEYQVSSMIRRLTTKRRKVGFTSGHGEPSLFQGLQAVQETLKDYEVTTVDLTDGKTPIPADVDVLVMVGPEKPLADRAKWELDQYLMKGKGLALFLDGMVLETPRGQLPPDMPPPRIGRANPVGLREQLAYYGVKVNEDIIMDPQNARVMLPAGGGQRVIVNYPGFPVVTGFSHESPITKDLKALVPIFPSSLEVSKEIRDGLPGGVKATALAWTTGGSWRHTGFFFFDPMHQPQPTKERGPFNLAVSLQGPMRSYFAGRPVPAVGPPTTPKENEPRPTGVGPKSPASTRLIVVGDSELVKDQFLGIFRENILLLENTVDYLAEDETLIAIRAKSQTRRPLEEVPDGTVAVAKYANIIGLPVVFIAFGLVRWRVRLAGRRRKAEEVRRTRGGGAR